MKNRPAKRKKYKSNSLSQQKIENTKYNFVKRLILFVFVIFILGFNTLVKVELKAQNNSESITIENLLTAHNEYRQDSGVGLLRLNSLLNESAKKKAEVMVATQCWSHYCPPGKSPWDFFDDAQYDYIYAGENLAEGYYSIDNLMQAWINSKTHRDNIVKSEFTEVGFSIIYSDYLNNPNNLLVVVHFGSSSQSLDSSVLSENNPSLEITYPQDNFTSVSDSIDVQGTVNSLENVRIFNNNSLQGEANISGGIFTYRISNLNEGTNTIWADGKLGDTTLNSNQIVVNYNSTNQSENIFVSDQEGFSMTVENKNIVNLVFIVFLILIFLADIILVSRTKALSSKKSFSHYHLSMFILVALIILIGGFAGHIQNGISI